MRLLVFVAVVCCVACQCGEPPKPCAQVCAGCCSASGECLTPTNDACGVSGATCAPCAPGDSCVAGLCSTPADGGPSDAGATDAGLSDGGQDGGCTAPETDADLCLAAGKDCGSSNLLDSCGATRSVNCGQCALPNSCGVTQADVCGCVGESVATLCARLGKSCGGPFTTVDGCGVTRSLTSCGTCQAPETCQASNVCACLAESDAAFCAAQGLACGPASGLDTCGASRTVSDCGACQAPQTCATGACSCVPETDPAFCARLGKNCGALAGTDNCGAARSVVSCGTCGAGTPCTGNVCGTCTYEGDVALCTRLGKDCGQVTAADRCGTSHTVTCGTCTAPQTCAGGGVANVCGCTSETTQQFCTRLGKNCGSVTQPDNCNVARTATCGNCTSPQTCQATNVCACIAEADAAFCARLNAHCGPVTALDNCNTSRTVASCGTCGPGTTCTGSACQCAPESDTAFCGRLGFNCGPVTGTDSCGLSRTVASCGTCTGTLTCGGAGAAHVCGCAAAPTAPNRCFLDQVECGAQTNSLWCGGPTQVDCGVCPDGRACVNNACQPICNTQGWCWAFPANGAGLAAAFALSATDVLVVGDQGLILRWNGSSWAMTSVPGVKGDLRAIHGSGPTEVWAVGNRAALRFDGSTWTQIALPAATISLRAVYVESPTSVYVVGDSGVALHWTGAAWVTLTTPNVNALNAVTLAGSTVLAAGASNTFLQLSGTTFASRTAPTFGATYTSLFATSATDIWVGGNPATLTGAVWQFDGTSWTQRFSASANALRVVGSGAGDVWGLFRNTLWRWDGAAASSYGLPTATGGLPLSATGVGLLGPAQPMLLQGNLASVAPTGWTTVLGSRDFAAGSGFAVMLGSVSRTASARWATMGIDTYVGVPWRFLQGATFATNAVFDSATDGDAFVVVGGASSGHAHSFILSGFSGTTLTAAQLAPTITSILRSVDVQANLFVAAGDLGTVLRSSAMVPLATVSWNPITTGTTQNLRGIWAGGATGLFWAVGDNGTLVREQAVGAPVVSSISAVALNDVHGLSVNDVWVVGTGGTILRWNGAAWSSFTSPTIEDLRGVRVYAATNVLVHTITGVLYRYDGANWAEETVPMAVAHLDGDATVGAVLSGSAGSWGSGGLLVR